jgi:hypothetical protein
VSYATFLLDNNKVTIDDNMQKEQKKDITYMARLGCGIKIKVAS